jgi:predicted TIM-barrel fold metal-dependent hydrolase
VWFGDDFAKERQEAIALLRDMNEYGARIVSDYKGRFGLFAVLPLPDVDASLREIEYAFDTLKADGVGLLTSYGTIWLGDPALQPVFDELNRRNAVVYTHPTDATCCHTLLPNTSAATVEWQTDTSRAIFNVINDNGGRTSAATRSANIRFIWSHGGGTVPFLAGRIDNASTGATDRLPQGFISEIKRFHYDTAGAANKGAIASLLQLVPASQILFGTDFPPGGSNLEAARTLSELGLFSPADLRAIERDNAVRLLPRLSV